LVQERTIVKYVDMIDRREEETTARSILGFPDETKLIDWGLDLLLHAFKTLVDAGVADSQTATIRASMHLQGRATSVLAALRRLATMGYWQEVVVLERVALEMIQRIEVYSHDEAKAEAYLKDNDKDYMAPSDLRKKLAGDDKDLLKRLQELYSSLSRFPHGRVIPDAPADELLAPPPDTELRMLLLTVSRLFLKLLSLLSKVYGQACDFGDGWRAERCAWALKWNQVSIVSSR
jgi:hypothetical protein